MEINHPLACKVLFFPQILEDLEECSAVQQRHSVEWAEWGFSGDGWVEMLSAVAGLGFSAQVQVRDTANGDLCLAAYCTCYTWCICLVDCALYYMCHPDFPFTEATVTAWSCAFNC